MARGNAGHADDLGPVYTSGDSFRARAEGRQREYRARVLRVAWARLGHILDEASAAAGENFLAPAIHDAARARARRKGVAKQTFDNMLASQAMCFNVFAPLAADPALATAVLGPALDVASVTAVEIEFTPPRDIFRDQSGRGGVDCDVLVTAMARNGGSVLIAVETKFVERKFSTCGFRERERIANGKPFCPDDVNVRADHGECLYAKLKRYAYWERASEFATLALARLPERGCAFAGAEWQLFVNHALVHAEAARRGAARAVFVVCAPEANHALLGDGILDRFRERLADPGTLRFVTLDALLDRIREVVVDANPSRRAWADALAARYGGI